MTAMEAVFQQMSEVIDGLESERQRRVGFLWKWLAGLGAVALVLSVYSRVSAGHWMWAIVAAVVGLLVWACVVSHQGKKFAAAFKSLVMPELIKSISSGLEYYPGNCIDENEFRTCGLYMAPDRYSGCDYVEGDIEKTHVRFSLVLAEEEYEVTDTHTDSDGRETTTTRTEYRDIFRGLFFSADCNKHFNGVTYVCAGGSGFFSRRRKDFVALEDPAFSKAFTVVSSDQVEARYLLTPNMMERLMELRSRAGKNTQVSFVGDRVYVAVPMALNAFTPSIWRRINDIGELAGYHGLMSFVVGIADDLNLNTRIWTKG